MAKLQYRALWIFAVCLEHNILLTFTFRMKYMIKTWEAWISKFLVIFRLRYKLNWSYCQTIQHGDYKYLNSQQEIFLRGSQKRDIEGIMPGMNHEYNIWLSVTFQKIQKHTFDINFYFNTKVI